MNGPEIANSIEAYLKDAEQEHILRPYQGDVFEDFQKSFQAGHRRVHVELPTGTGKTVLFVELSKALLGNQDQRPRILVVVPTKDLVYQTVGSTGEKGYGKFAPDLKIGTYFSDTPKSLVERLRIKESDVIVTTYQSFRILGREWRPGQGSRLNEFDIFILDEAHHALGEKASEIINSLPKEKLIIGFTATPGKLASLLPHKAHTLELKEAIGLGIVAPIMPLGIKSGIQVSGSDLYNENGEFIDNKIRYLARDPGRNRLVLDAARILTDNGIGTIISCIAGEEAWHAKYLAEKLIKEGVRAEPIYDAIPAKQRQAIYRQFEAGEIDVLTYIGVLAEGWDSKRAKALINARPTRSVILAKQRLGRITRPGSIAIPIDICDEYEDKAPVISVADMLDSGDIPAGTIMGDTGNTTPGRTILETLKRRVPIIPVLQSTYQDYQTLLASLNINLEYGYGSLESILYALPSRINPSYSGVTEEIIDKLEKLRGVTIEKKAARQKNIIRLVYNIEQVARLLDTLSVINPYRYYTDDENNKWLASEGLLMLFSKRFSGLTLEVVEDQLQKLGNQLNWIPARLSRSSIEHKRLFAVRKIYKQDQLTINLLNQTFIKYFAYGNLKG